jgi:hypothetical protein
LMIRATEFVYVVRDRPSINSKKGRVSSEKTTQKC